MSAYAGKFRIKPLYWERVLKPVIFQFMESNSDCVVENAPGEFVITGRDEIE